MREMRELLRALAGLFGWAASFTLVYALHGLGCARGWHLIPVGHTDQHRAVLLGTWTVCLLLLGLLALRTRRAEAGAQPHQRLLARLARSSAWVGFVATAFTLVSVVTASSCV
ncbi:hypothetical protein [uncultured Azohydromonas sp.]|jgi:hypothetical protein|uniref:hypothetical protein n=1 Tax=uncultured Azohydromonas sp. TaxID=487342 RepID=UPI0026392F1C|nr:hypothetical protein [uncultured Azohydromonas sp.]